MAAAFDYSLDFENTEFLIALADAIKFRVLEGNVTPRERAMVLPNGMVRSWTAVGWQKGSRSFKYYGCMQGKQGILFVERV